MKSYVRSKLTLAFVTLVMLAGAVAAPLASSIRHAQASRAVTTTSTIPGMKLPWDTSLNGTIPFTGGPHSIASLNDCVSEPVSSMSGVDFGFNQDTDVLAVAAGQVIYAAYYDSQIRYAVMIDHGGGFLTQYWHLDSIDPSIKPGVQVAQGSYLGKSGYSPGNSGPVYHLHLEFSQYTSSPIASPLSNTPYSANGLSIDGYTLWTFTNSNGQGLNYEGSMTRGATTSKDISISKLGGSCTGHTKVTGQWNAVDPTPKHSRCPITFYTINCTIIADAGRGGGYPVSSNSKSLVSSCTTTAGSTFYDDFSSDTPGQTPSGYLMRGASGAAPTVQEFGGTGPAYRLLSFPYVGGQYWDSWALESGLPFCSNYTFTVKLNFQTSGDRGGVTIAWNDTNWNRIDIQPNIYWQDIEFRISYTGPISSSPVVTGAALTPGGLPMQTGTNYWLRVVATSAGPGQGQVNVYWSADGNNFISEVAATGLATLDGLVGVGTAGPNLPNVYFDDLLAQQN